VQNKAAPCPLDHVNRVFHAPARNRLWRSDFTSVRHLVGLRLGELRHRSLCPPHCRPAGKPNGPCELRLDALEQALQERRPVHRGIPTRFQEVSIRYTERLADAGIDLSVGSVGDSYDIALSPRRSTAFTQAEVTIGVGHGETSRPSSSRHRFGSTGSTISCFSEPIGNVPSVEAEERFYAMLPAKAA
jgi:putative transposase